MGVQKSFPSRNPSGNRLIGAQEIDRRIRELWNPKTMPVVQACHAPA